MTRVLFVTWDGPQVSYVESLFIPIFRKLAAEGFPFDIVQFRWGLDDATIPLRHLCEEAGIGLRLHKIARRAGSVGAMATAVAGSRAIRTAAATFGSTIIMPRSLMPALAILSGRRWPQRLIFDADGLPADERVEFAGLDANGMTYRLLRDVEAQMTRKAATTIVRSDAAKQILLARAGPTIAPAQLHVVTNGRDATVFAPLAPARRVAVRADLNLAADTPLLVYAGSVGPQYRLSESVALLAAVHRHRPDAVLLILTGSPELVGAALGEHRSGMEDKIIVRSVPPEAVPAYVAGADVAIAYRKPSFSMQAVAPIKVAEYLLCGTPVIGTALIGDMQKAVDAGVFTDESVGHAAAAEWIIEKLMGPGADTIRARAREVGVLHFSLDRAVQDYLAALRTS